MRRLGSAARAICTAATSRDVQRTPCNRLPTPLMEELPPSEMVPKAAASATRVQVQEELRMLIGYEKCADDCSACVARRAQEILACEKC